MSKKRILVFPCGSEVALEIHRSLMYSTHFELIGASSVDDHGRFVYRNYHTGLPFHDEPEFLSKLKELVDKEKIDAIYPAMDAVASTLSSNAEMLGCRVIGSDDKLTKICNSKMTTYTVLKDLVRCPYWTNDLDSVFNFPSFMKPDQGYGSRHSYRIENRDAANQLQKENGQIDFIFCEYLPGKEFTIDCFSDKEGNLLFHGARERARVSNGISVRTIEVVEHQVEFENAARMINSYLKPRGAWFFQMKENSYGQPTLLEVAVRLGGSSSYFRAKGVNFALLSAFDAFDIPVNVDTNIYDVTLDRALTNRYSHNIIYERVYIDFDDCRIVNGQINLLLINFLYQCLNNKVLLTLITRHEFDIHLALKRFRINQLFDEVIHLRNGEKKSDFIIKEKSIFIDDSFKERKDVSERLKIPVFAPDMVEILIG